LGSLFFIGGNILIRLIAADMDGSLLNDNHEINPEFWEVLKKLKAKMLSLLVLVEGSTTA
jgi:hydroxymethylpyrimidine pyrophosphatase-like HAD family hydrolase